MTLLLGVVPNLNANPILGDTTTYVKIEIKGLSCPFCAYGLEKKLKEVEGATDIKIDVKEGIAIFTVIKKEQPNKKQLRQVVKDAGFTAGEITFSTTSFTKGKDD